MTPVNTNSNTEYLLKQILVELKRMRQQQEQCCTEQGDVLNEIVEILESIEVDIHKLVPRPAVSATLTLITEGDPAMPATIHINGNGAQATFTEFDQPGGAGNVVPPLGPVVFSSSDATIATVDPTGKCTAVAAGTATITGMDQGNSLTASDSLTVTAGVAVSATLTLAPL